MDKITVIIPVYNVEKYLRKCIDSVINQSYKNLEIICVDDGSTDSCGIILDEYEKIDDRIIVIHQENKGVSEAKNIALKNMSGDYVGFVDSDDWIEYDFYEEAYEAMLQSGADIFCSGIYEEKDNICIKRENKFSINKKILNRNDMLLYAFKRDYYRNFGAYLWNKLFRAELVKDIFFDKELKVAEDVLFFSECVLKGKKFIYTDKAYYHYFQRNDSFMHSKDTDIREHHLLGYNRVIQKIQNSDLDNAKDVLLWVKRFYVYHATVLAEFAISNGDKEKLSFYKNEIRRYLNEYIITNKDFKDRIIRVNDILEYRL